MNLITTILASKIYILSYLVKQQKSNYGCDSKLTACYLLCTTFSSGTNAHPDMQPLEPTLRFPSGSGLQAQDRLLRVSPQAIAVFHPRMGAVAEPPTAHSSLCWTELHGAKQKKDGCFAAPRCPLPLVSVPQTRSDLTYKRFWLTVVSFQQIKYLITAISK